MEELCTVGLTRVDTLVVVDNEVAEVVVCTTEEVTFTDESSDGRIGVACGVVVEEDEDSVLLTEGR